VRRGWLAAILLLFLARYLPLGKQRKCFGGLSICSFGFRVAWSFQPPPTPSLPSPFPDQSTAEPLDVRKHTQLDTHPGR
uniref:Secreted protein n=1 Tax=Sus scrofa TaxID=9823 RepID=A0A4X1UKB1_PIG